MWYTKFSDIPVHIARGRSRPKKVVLIAPHTNEHPAVLPFQSALAKHILDEGITVDEHRVDDMMKRGWSFRSFILEKCHSLDDLNDAGAVLGQEDILTRVRILFSTIDSTSTTGLEIHAYEDTEDSMSFSFPCKTARLKNTRILFVNDVVGLFENFMRNHCMPKSNHLADEIAKARGFDLDDSRSESLVKLKKLRRYKIKCIEIPSIPTLLPEEHPMCNSYYGVGAERSLFCSYKSTNYETYYCARTREGMGFSQNELSAALSILNIRK